MYCIVQLPPAPLQLTEWAEKTVLSAACGAIVQGLLQRMVEKTNDTTVEKQPVRAIAQGQKARFTRTVQAAMRGAMRFGFVSGIFFGTELVMSIYRAKYDYYNATCGGLASGAFVGLSCTLLSSIIHECTGHVFFNVSQHAP